MKTGVQNHLEGQPSRRQIVPPRVPAKRPLLVDFDYIVPTLRRTITG
jgi:hypothetical protein